MIFDKLKAEISFKFYTSRFAFNYSCAVSYFNFLIAYIFMPSFCQTCVTYPKEPSPILTIGTIEFINLST